MKITKFGHCCLLIEEKGVRILTDPGNLSDQQNKVLNLDLILITHEHPDHFHIESLKEVLKNNPGVRIITNRAVGALLETENVSFEIVEEGQKVDVNGVNIEGFGNLHEVVVDILPRAQNTGYFISDRLFLPGDAFTNPGKKVDLLALPVAGPWLKLSESIAYALEIKPNTAFPVHEGILKSPGTTHALPPKVLEPAGIKFMVLDIDKEYEI